MSGTSPTTLAALLAALALCSCGSSASRSSPASTPAASTPAASTPAASTPAASTPAATRPPASTPAASTPAATTPAAATTGAGTTATGSAEVSASAYEAEMVAGTAARQKLGLSIETALKAAPKLNDAEVFANFTALAAEAQADHAALAKLRPPAADRPAAAAYTADYGALATDLAAIAKAGQDGSAADAKAATEQLFKDIEKLQVDSPRLKELVLGHD